MATPLVRISCFFSSSYSTVTDLFLSLLPVCAGGWPLLVSVVEPLAMCFSCRMYVCLCLSVSCVCLSVCLCDGVLQLLDPGRCVCLSVCLSVCLCDGVVPVCCSCWAPVGVSACLSV